MGYQGFSYNYINSALLKAKYMEENLLAGLGKKSIEELNQAVKEIMQGKAALLSLISSGDSKDSIEEVFLKELEKEINEIKVQQQQYNQAFLDDAAKYFEHLFGNEGYNQTKMTQALNSTLSRGGAFTSSINAEAFSSAFNGLEYNFQHMVKIFLNQASEAARKALPVLVNQYMAQERDHITNYNLQEILTGKSKKDLLSMTQSLGADNLSITLKIEDFNDSEARQKILKLFGSLTEKELEQIDPSGEIRKRLVDSLRLYILNRLPSADGELQSVINEIFSSDKEVSRLIFQGGNAVKHLRGLLGEALGMYIFSKLLGKDNVKWNAQSLLDGEQSHTDIILIINDLVYGVQVKNYSKGHDNVDFATLSPSAFKSLAEKIPNGNLIYNSIQEIFQMEAFNIEYVYRNNEPVEGANPNFAGVRSKIESLKDTAMEVLAQLSAALLYIQTSQALYQDGDPGGNTLFMIGNDFISSRQILEDIAFDAKTSGFSVAANLEGRQKGETIIDYIKNNKISSYKDLKIRMTSSYNFGGFRT